MSDAVQIDLTGEHPAVVAALLIPDGAPVTFRRREWAAPERGWLAYSWVCLDEIGFSVLTFEGLEFTLFPGLGDAIEEVTRAR